MRVRGGINAEGVLQFHDFKFDFSAKALHTMETEKPESYALYLATRKYLFAQPGFVMHQRVVRPCKIANPNALVCTTAANLVVAQEKDARKMTSDTMQLTEPWLHDPKGTRIIGRTFKVKLLTEEVGHEGIWAKVERYLLFEKKFHMLEFKFSSPTGLWVYEFSSVQEVYEAIRDSRDSVVPSDALALLSRPPDMSM